MALDVDNMFFFNSRRTRLTFATMEENGLISCLKRKWGVCYSSDDISSKRGTWQEQPNSIKADSTHTCAGLREEHVENSRERISNTSKHSAVRSCLLDVAVDVGGTLIEAVRRR